MMTPMRFTPDDDGATPVHSSGYAHAANGQAMGAMSPQSYTERRQLELNRQHVRHYRHSRLGQAYGEIRSMTVPARPETARVQHIERSPAIEAPKRHTFHEPPKRFNPYS